MTILRLTTGHDSLGRVIKQKDTTTGTITTLTQSEYDAGVAGYEITVSGSTNQVINIPSKYSELWTSDPSAMNGHGHMWQDWEEIVTVDQKVDIYFYPDMNISDPIVNQKADIYFYPDNNISDPVINQEVKIEFYPDGNVTDPDPTVINQEVKIEFYPDGNVTDVVTPVTENGFKFWFGMKGKKRYGKGFTRKVSF